MLGFFGIKATGLEAPQAFRSCSLTLYAKRHFKRELSRPGGELRELTGLSRKQISQVLDAFYDELWKVLLSGNEAKLGPVGKIYLQVRAPSVQEFPAAGEVVETPQTISLRGKASAPLKQAYWDFYGMDYPDDLDEIEN